MLEALHSQRPSPLNYRSSASLSTPPASQNPPALPAKQLALPGPQRSQPPAPAAPWVTVSMHALRKNPWADIRGITNINQENCSADAHDSVQCGLSTAATPGIAPVSTTQSVCPRI